MGISIDDDTVADAATVRLIASQKAWIEGKAIEQLHAAARLPGMEMAVGFPDLHPGKGIPVGAAFVSRRLFHPTLAGNDIGCAMSFWATDLPRRKLKVERWAKRISGLEAPWDGDIAAWCARYELPDSGHNIALGTIGGGNHFAELQIVEQVRDRAAFEGLGLDADLAFLLIHSGSRSLGEVIYRDLIARHGSDAIEEGSADAMRYLASHDHACRFARASRALIAHRFGAQIGAQVRLVSDVEHNTVTRELWRGTPAWIHRKGAASSRKGALVIPGSRGTPSFLVVPTGDGEAAAGSLAHGAGRRWQRGYAKPRLSEKYRVADLERTDLGSHVICEDRELIYEEAPQAYKDIRGVIADLEAAGLVRVIAEMKPVLTYKVRRRGDD